MVATAETNLLFNIVIGKNDVVNQLDVIQKRATQLGRLQAQGFEVGPQTEQFKKLATQAGVTGSALKNAFNTGTRAASQFDARMLTLLFAGMALQRAFGGILRSIKNTFSKAEGDTSALSQATVRLTAAWEFLKFSIFDALNTPFFIFIIDGVVRLLNFFARLSPAARLAILGVIAGLALIGTALVLIAQLKLAWDAILGTGGAVAAGSKIRGAFITMLGPIGLLLLAIGLVVAAFNKFPNTANTIKDSFLSNFGKIAKNFASLFGDLFVDIEATEVAMRLFGAVGLGVMVLLGNAVFGAILGFQLLTTVGKAIIRSMFILAEAVTLVSRSVINFLAALRRGKGVGAAIEDLKQTFVDFKNTASEAFSDTTADVQKFGDSVKVFKDFEKESLGAIANLIKFGDESNKLATNPPALQSTEPGLATTDTSPFLNADASNMLASSNAQVTASFESTQPPIEAETEALQANTAAKESNAAATQKLNEVLQLGAQLEAGQDVSFEQLINLSSVSASGD